MTTYREAIYMCLDLLKGMSDDFSYTEEHVAYLLDKFRALLLKQRYGNDPKKHVPYSNYQTLSISLKNDVDIQQKKNRQYIKSGSTIPYMMQIGIPRIVNVGNSVGKHDYYDFKYEFVSRERIPFVGNNKYTNKIVYCAIDDQGFFIIKNKESFYDQNNYSLPINLELVGIFENPREVLNSENYLDLNIPIEEGLVTTLIEMVVKELAGSMYIPNDTINNASDDKADLATFLRTNTKSDLAKQLSR